MFSTHARPAAIRGFLLFYIYFWLNVKLSHQSVKCFRYMYVYLRRKVHVENVTINRICLWFTWNICKMCQLISHVGLWLWVNYEYGLFVYALGSLFLVPHNFFFWFWGSDILIAKSVRGKKTVGGLVLWSIAGQPNPQVPSTDAMSRPLTSSGDICAFSACIF